MYTKLIVLCCMAAMALSTPIKYPAGIHPAVCPNYPYCDLAALARHTPAGLPIPEWELNPAILPVAPFPHAATFPTVKYPAGVHPSVCPNYPYCF